MLPFGVLFFLILFGSIVANPIIGYAQDDSEFDDENEGADEDDTSFPPEEEEDEDDTDVVIEEEDEDDTDVVIEEEDEDDTDGDGVSDDNDNCPNTPNPDQSDVDEDGAGDQCDTAINNGDTDDYPDDDTDGDGVSDVTDNCPDQANPDQRDSDGDGIGDACYQTQVGSITTIEAFNDIVEEATGPEGAAVTYSDMGLTCTGPSSGSTLQIGEYTVECLNIEPDHQGPQFKIIVQDTTPPVISNVPADITVNAPYGADGVTVTYPIPTANDIVDGPVVVNCKPTSGFTFSLGTTTVHCTATDSHENEAGPATFTINVISNTPATLQLPSDITEELLVETEL